MDSFDRLTIDNVRIGIMLAVVLIAVATDVRRRRIYNVLTLPAMGVGLITGAMADGASGLLSALAGLVLGAAIFALPVAFLGRGAGDLKLLAAIGSLGGPVFVVWCALLTGAAGAVLAVAVLLAKKRFGVVIGGIALNTMAGQFPVATSGIRLPYAVPIAAGALMTLALIPS